MPLISPEKGAQLGFVAQGMLLVVSGVYYPVEVLPQWMQWLSVISPATYVLNGIRDAILNGAGLSTMGTALALLLIGVSRPPSGSGSSAAARSTRRSTASSSVRARRRELIRRQ